MASEIGFKELDMNRDELPTKTKLYRKFGRKIIFITLMVSFTPLILLGGTIYYQFAKVYEEKIEDQIRHLARSQCNTVDVFLRERTSILSTIVDTNTFDKLKDEEYLSWIFTIINRRAEGLGFVDIGVIDDTGHHLAYVGPYNLRGLNYYHQPWFSEVMSKGKYISDVYYGFSADSAFHHCDQRV